MRNVQSTLIHSRYFFFFFLSVNACLIQVKKYIRKELIREERVLVFFHISMLSLHVFVWVATHFLLYSFVHCIWNLLLSCLPKSPHKDCFFCLILQDKLAVLQRGKPCGRIAGFR